MERFSTGKSDHQRRTRLPLVNVMVNSRAYTIACDEGEEEHLRELAKHVDAKVRELLETVGQVGDSRLLLMAALLITDDYFDAVHRLEARAKDFEDLTGASSDAKSKLSSFESQASDVIRAARKRIGDIAARLAEA
jgi:cell division protein ZapA